ncbi:MAG: NADPH:quinone reductase [Planctomycetaceae bacterium]|nr:NADPH:quinone reductase [Planctomycetaceae bacterium]
MKAAVIRETGSPSCIKIEDLPVPLPGRGEVLVRVRAVAVNPIDTYIRSGAVKAQLPVPYVIGCDLAGDVEAVGSDVQRFRVGDRVWGSNQGLAGRQGSFSEQAAVGEQWLYPVPDGVSYEQAAAGALTGITAHLGLFLHGGLQAGDVVFVNGGTGGVGSAVVQIAAASEATVITTVGSSAKAEEARRLGADYVINYRDGDPFSAVAQLAEKAGKVNLWFETLRTPSPEQTFPLLARRGRYILMAGRDARPVFPVGPFYVNDLRAVGFAMFNASADEQRRAADSLNAMMAAGRLKPFIGRTFPLEQAAAAHELQEANTLNGAGTLSGKIVLTM